MIYVVTPTGVVIEYSGRNSVHWESSKEYIATIKETGTENFVAKVPRGCVVSFQRPHVVKQAPSASFETVQGAIDLLSACIETHNPNWSGGRRMAELKRKLKDFDGRSRCWK